MAKTGRKVVQRRRWDRDVREEILQARERLIELGMERPSIRAVLYLLMRVGWQKKDYTELCRHLGAWRDRGVIPFGLFADDAAGQGLRPLTAREIVERIRGLQDMVPAALLPDGKVRAILVEHVSLVHTVGSWLDYRAPVASCQGQLRREFLHAQASAWTSMAEELGGEMGEVLMLTDYDAHGKTIYEATAGWLRRVFGLKVRRWAITAAQAQAAGLDRYEDHQLDGWVAAYGPDRTRRELRRAVGLRGGGGEGPPARA